MRYLRHSNWHRAIMIQSIMTLNSAGNVAIQAMLAHCLQVFIQAAAVADNFPLQPADSLFAL